MYPKVPGGQGRLGCRQEKGESKLKALYDQREKLKKKLRAAQKAGAEQSERSFGDVKVGRQLLCGKGSPQVRKRHSNTVTVWWQDFKDDIEHIDKQIEKSKPEATWQYMADISIAVSEKDIYEGWLRIFEGLTKRDIAGLKVGKGSAADGVRHHQYRGAAAYPAKFMKQFSKAVVGSTQERRALEEDVEAALG